jgi:hypothetical protein
MPREAPVMTATFLSLLMLVSFILAVTDIPVPMQPRWTFHSNA